MLAKRKGANREVGSEGSVEQSCVPTHRNRIRGRRNRASVRRNTKPITINDSECTSGGSAANDIELTLRDLVAVQKDWGSREATRTYTRSQQRAGSGGKKDSGLREPERHPKGFNGRENKDANLMTEEQQKRQLKLTFSWKSRGETSGSQRAGAEAEVAEGETEVPVPESLMEQVANALNLKEAYFEVKANKGSPGIDEMTVDQLGEYFVGNRDKLSQSLLTARINQNQ